MNNATFLGRSLWICLLVLFGTTAANAQLTPVIIVKEGDLSPDTGDAITSIFGNFCVNENMVFVTEADDDGPTASDDFYWVNDLNAPAPMALYRAGATLSDTALVTSTNSLETTQHLNASGALLWEAICTTTDGTSRDYLMRDLTILASEGQIAAHDGGNFSFFSRPCLTDAGDAYAEIDTTGSSPGDEAVYVFPLVGAPAPVALAGGAGLLIEGGAITAGPLAGNAFDSSSCFNDIIFNGAGDMVGEAELEAVSPSTDDLEFILVQKAGALTYEAHLIEDTTMVTVAAGTDVVVFVSNTALAENGDWCTEISLSTAGAITSSNDNVLMASFGGAAPIPVFEEGEDFSAAFGGAAVTMGFITSFDINSNGQVMCLVGISGPGAGAGTEAWMLYDHTSGTKSLLFADESPFVLAGAGAIATDLDSTDPIISDTNRYFVQLSDSAFVDYWTELVDLPPDECILQKSIADGTTAYDTTGATTSATTNGACVIADDHWYRYTASCLGTATVSTTAGHDLAAYFGADCPADGANELACLGTSITFAVTEGAEYLIRVGGGVAGPGDLTISCAPIPPVNDTCALSIAGPSFPSGSYAWDNTLAGTDGPAGSCASLSADVWIKTTATCEGDLIVDGCDTSADTVIEIYPANLGCALTSADAIGCADQGCPSGNGSLVSATITAGDEYLIRIGGWNGDTGNGTVTFACVPPVRMNEVRNDQLPSSTTDQEYVELVGPAGYDLSSLTIVTVGDAFTPMSGGLDDVTPLTGVIGTSGYYLLADSSTFGYDLTATADQFESLNFENTDNVTHILVLDYTGPTSTSTGDLDFDNDGNFDEPVPWATLVDSIGLEQPTTSTAAPELLYGPNIVQGIGAFRCPDAIGPWLAHGSSAAGDTPGAANTIPDDKTAPGVLVVGNNPFCTNGATTDGVDLDPLVCDLGFSNNSIFNDVWYCFTADCAGDYTMSTCNEADFDTRLAVYSGCGSDNPANVVACNDDVTGCSGNTSELTFTATEGGTYLVRIGAFGATGSGVGTLVVTASIPGDTCDTALVAVDGLNPVDTNCAITDGTDLSSTAGGTPDCAAQFGGVDFARRAQVFTYTPAVDGSLLVATCNDNDPLTGGSESGYDTRLVVYSSASCPTDVLDVIACDDDNDFDALGNCNSSTFGGSALHVVVTGGNTYLIEVGGFGTNDFGLATLALNLTPFCEPVTLDDLSADVTAGDAPLTVNFTSMISGDTPTYDWDFGDGQSSTDAVSTVHVFNTPGTYTVTLDVVNNCGMGSDTVTITVCAPVVASFDVSNDTGIATHCADFTDTTTGDVASLLWDLDGDSTPDAAGSTASFMYTTPGTYTASLSVVGSCGGADSATATITVLGMGDCNGDGAFDIGDPVRLATYLFGGGVVPECPNACDTNGDGANDLGDVVYSLFALFTAGPAPVAPVDCTLCN